MVILLTYDLSSKWTEVKHAAIANGFRDFAITNADQRFNLQTQPCLWRLPLLRTQWIGSSPSSGT